MNTTVSDFRLFENATNLNGTASFDDRTHWSALPVVLAILIPFALFLNAGVGFALVFTHRTQPPFNIYLINLTLSNFCFSLFYLPLDIVNTIYTRWSLGHAACLFYQFAYWVFHGCLTNAHVLLTINRLWAVFFPLHYHCHQAGHRKVAIGVCVEMWIYVSMTAGVFFGMTNPS